MPGRVLADPGQAQGNVDHPSWVSYIVAATSVPALKSSFVIVSGLSALVAWVMAKIFKLKKSQT
jgi:hypothetical protein